MSSYIEFNRWIIIPKKKIYKPCIREGSVAFRKTNHMWEFLTVYHCLSSFLFKSLYKSHLLVARSYVALSTIWVHFLRSNTSMRLNKTMNAWILLSRFKILSRIFIFLLQTPFRWTKHNIIEYISLFKPFI